MLGADVVGQRIARRGGGLHQGVVQQAAGVDGHDVQGAVAAVVLARTAPAGLHLLEVGQHVGIAPALAAHLPPSVVVARVAAHVEHAVDRGRAAEQPAAGQVEGAVVEIGLGLGDVTPVVLGVQHGAQEAQRHPHIGMVVLAPGLDEQDLAALVLAEPRGQNAAGRTGADDDVVVSAGRGRGLGEGLGHAPVRFASGGQTRPRRLSLQPLLHGERCWVRA